MKNSTIVLIILILVVGVGLYYVSVRGGTGTGSTISTTTTSTTTPGGDTTGWLTYQGAKVSLMYPSVFTVNDVSASNPIDWRIDANNNPGTLDFSATLPQSFEPQTNFGDAKLTVGESANATAVGDCLTPDQSGGAGPSMTTKVINGTTFTVFTFSDAGAGNLYDSTSYRAVQSGTCFAIEYTIHYSQIANYPPDAGISQFDEAKVKALMEQVAGTVTLH